MSDRSCGDRVARAFSKAAEQYEGLAAVQATTGRELISLLPSDALAMGQLILDAGCGSGYLTRELAEAFPQQQCMGIDLADGMIRRASEHDASRLWAVGDILRLPLPDACCSLVFSNFAVQWCGHPPAVIASFERVLGAGGLLAFSVPLPGSLEEISKSWSGIDGNVHVNTFHGAADWREAVSSCFDVVDCSELTHTLYYPSVRECLNAVRGVGASVVVGGQRRSLTGKGTWRAFVEAYERLRVPAGIPLTYRVLRVVARKQGQ